jgi:mannobiose 2-epimerase
VRSTGKNLPSLQQLGADALRELTENILPFSMQLVLDRERGGFYGYVANDRTVRKDAPKGLVQHARMLWTFCRADRAPGNPDYRPAALHARDALMNWFWDPRHGGFVWMVDYRGRPIETHKWTYGQAFGIYALAECHLDIGDAGCLNRAIDVYRLLELHCHDPHHGGYSEVCRRDWAPAPGQHVDPTPLPVAKGMNSHLHVLEAYTSLLRAWPEADLRASPAIPRRDGAELRASPAIPRRDGAELRASPAIPRRDGAELRASLRGLIELTLRRIINPATGHFWLYFSQDWRPLSDLVSYGHDIEGSWLLVEAAEVLGDADLLAETRQAALQMAYATLEQGVDSDGGVFNEGDPAGPTDRGKVWWPQAEAVVGFLNAYQLSGDARFLDAALAAWRFIQERIVDKVNGDWLWGLDAAGRPLDREKAGPWKAAYHSGRACMEVMWRVEELVGGGEKIHPC